MWAHIAVAGLIAGCAHRGPDHEAESAPGEGPRGPWSCTAYVSRVATEERIDVQGKGPTIEEAYAAAWVNACAALPQTEPPTPCSDEAPRPGWTWTREDLDGVVTLHLLPEPPPFQGVATSTVSRDEACEAAYANACLAAGGKPDCLDDPAYADGGVGAVAPPAPQPPEGGAP